MNTKRFSIIVTAGVLAALLLATGASASEPRLEPNEPSEENAEYQIIKKEVVVQHETDEVLDYDAMLFLEANVWDYEISNAGFLQVDTADAIEAYSSPCQGEGFTDAVDAQSGVIGLILTYCSFRADFLGVPAVDVAPAIPLHPDFPDGGLYDTPAGAVPDLLPHSSWPVGYTDY